MAPLPNNDLSLWLKTHAGPHWGASTKTPTNPHTHTEKCAQSLNTWCLLIFSSDRHKHLHTHTHTHGHTGGRWPTDSAVCGLCDDSPKTPSGASNTMTGELSPDCSRLIKAVRSVQVKTRGVLSSSYSWSADTVVLLFHLFLHTRLCLLQLLPQIPFGVSGMFVKDLAFAGPLFHRKSPPESVRITSPCCSLQSAQRDSADKNWTWLERRIIHFSS